MLILVWLSLLVVGFVDLVGWWFGRCSLRGFLLHCCLVLVVWVYGVVGLHVCVGDLVCWFDLV